MDDGTRVERRLTPMSGTSGRPPSVDALARSIAGSGLPHPILVEVARAAIADGETEHEQVAARAETYRRSLLTPVVNATGVLLHTNLGRAPLAHRQSARAQTVEFDLATGERGSRQTAVGQLFATITGAEAAMVVNNNAAAVLLVVAALAAGRDVAVSRGESVEIGGAFRVPEVMEQSGARLVDVGTTNRTRLTDYERAIVRHGNDVALLMKIHPSNFRVEGFVEETSIAELATLDRPVVADIGSGLLDATVPWLKGAPPAWLAGEPAAVQALGDGADLVTFSGDKLLGGPQAGIIAGSADLVRQCAGHPLARALRCGGLVLAALQDVALAYLDKRAGTDIPFWRMVDQPIDTLPRPRRTDRVRCGDRLGDRHRRPPRRRIGARGDHAVRRCHDRRRPADRVAHTSDAGDRTDPRRPNGARPPLGRPGRRRDRHRCAARPRPMRVVATAGHVDHGKSSLVLALTGTDPDRFEEEKRRGLTIDLGFADTTLPSGAPVSFVDVPGHVRFLRNMLAGVGGVDACLFVVAATEGWKPQSEEHLRILELLGIRHGVIALTKRDLVDDEWLEIAVLEVADHVGGTFLAGAPIVPVASISGDGLDDLRTALDVLVAETPPSVDRARPRLWIDRVFAAKGSGTVVTGTLTGGTLRHDETVAIEPGGHSARIRSIQSLGAVVDEIGPGNRVALNLNGVGHDDVGRGDAVITLDRWRATERFDASLDVLASLDHEVSRRGAYVAYIGSRELPVRVRVLGGEALAPGTSGSVRLFLDTTLPLLPGDRYVLRESGRDETIGGGEVLDIDPITRASRAQPDRSIERVVRERGRVDVDELELLTGERVEPTVGRWVTTPEELAAAHQRLRAAIDDAGELGLDIAALDDHDRAVIETLDEIVIETGRVRGADAVDPFADHPVIEQIRAGGFAPDVPTGDDHAAVRELIRRGTLVERDKIVFHVDSIDAAARVAAELLADDADGFTVAQFRDRTGASRKFALPLVAELDARGVTRRRDDLRIAGPRLPDG